MPEKVLSKDAVKSALPDLRIAPNTTKFSALHNIRYTGRVSRWQSFDADVWASMSTSWSQAIIDYKIDGRDLREEEVYVADETGVQGRFEQSVGQILGAVFRAQHVNIRFADF